ncbi:MAG: hypothetical protein ACRC23_02035 [Aeromonas jandaei]
MAKYIAKENGIFRYNGVSDVEFKDNSILVGLDTSLNEKYVLSISTSEILDSLVGDNANNKNHYRISFASTIITAIDELFKDSKDIQSIGCVQNAMVTAIHEQLDAYNIIF